MTEPTKLADVPTVRLNGKDWPVPELGPRCLRKSRAAIVAVNDALLARHETDEPLPDNDDAARKAFGQRTAARYTRLDDEHYGMMCDAVFWGLKAAHKDLPPEEFEDWPLTPGELFDAYLVVRRQSLLYGRYGSPSPGEAEAANEKSRSASPTGTD